MKRSLPYVVVLIHILWLAAAPLQAQQFSDEDIEAMLRTRQFEIGGTRATEPKSQEEGHPGEGEGGDADDASQASDSAVANASGAARQPVNFGTIIGFARSLMDRGTAGAGDLPLPAAGTPGQDALGSVGGAASAIAASGGDAAQLPGADGGELLQQIGSMPEGPGGTALPAPLAASALDNARALLDAYNAAASASAEATGNEERTPEPSGTQATGRVRPSARTAPERRDEEEREPSPSETSPRGASRGAAAVRVPSSPARSSAGAAPSGGGRTTPTAASASPAATVPAATVREDRRAVRPGAASAVAHVDDQAAAKAAPERFRELLEAAPTYADAVAEREGDWFVVLGSYNVRAGAAPVPSAVDGSVEPSASASIAAAQQRLWDAGYVPYVVRSEALPRFESGLAVIVLGPLPRGAALAQLPALRRIVSDAYIKAGW